VRRASPAFDAKESTMTMIETVPGTPVWHTIGTAFGHRFRLALGPGDVADEVRARAGAVLHEVEQVCGRRVRDSELLRVNLGAGRWRRTSEPFREVLRASLEMARFTDGLVDPSLCVAPRHLERMEDVAGGLPERVALPRACPRGGWQSVDLRWDGKVRIPSGHVLDLSAAATALAAERIVRTVAGVAARGEFRAADVIVGIGEAAGGPEPSWPGGPGPTAPGPAAVVDGARTVATAWGWPRSGLRSLSVRQPAGSGKRYPAGTFWRSVTVTDPSCAVARAAAHAAVVLGPSAIGWLARRELPARLVHRDGEIIRVGDWPRTA
jgi:FAD:protein FMN transferase